MLELTDKHNADDEGYSNKASGDPSPETRYQYISSVTRTDMLTVAP